jgi:hypothetical protein
MITFIFISFLRLKNRLARAINPPSIDIFNEFVSAAKAVTGTPSVCYPHFFLGVPLIRMPVSLQSE